MRTEITVGVAMVIAGCRRTSLDDLAEVASDGSADASPPPSCVDDECP